MCSGTVMRPDFHQGQNLPAQLIGGSCHLLSTSWSSVIMKHELKSTSARGWQDQPGYGTPASPGSSKLECKDVVHTALHFIPGPGNSLLLDVAGFFFSSSFLSPTFSCSKSLHLWYKWNAQVNSSSLKLDPLQEKTVAISVRLNYFQKWNHSHGIPLGWQLLPSSFE